MNCGNIFLIMFWGTNALAAAKEGVHHPSVADLLYPAINFVLLFGFILWRLKKPVSEMFKKNARETQDFFNMAKEKDKEAKIKLTMYKSKMEHFESEAEKLRKEMSEDALKFEQIKEHETNQVIDKMIQDAIAKVENEKNLLIKKLNTSLVDQVISKTKDMISSNSDYKAKATKKLVSQI